MMNSITKNKLISVLSKILPILFWLGVYEIFVFSVSNEYFLPHIWTVAVSLLGLIKTGKFYLVCLFTLLRVITALLLGAAFGIVLGIFSARYRVVFSVLNPFMTAVKATPVASLIIVLWILLSGDMLSIIIALFMVLPIVWQSAYNSFDTIDKGLSEVCDVFEVGAKYRFKILYLPNLKKYLAPSIVTSVGLAWKSEIATEIIAYTKNSIGQLINDGKYELDTPRVFAWTLVVIIFSVIFEGITKMFLRRLKYEP